MTRLFAKIIGAFANHNIVNGLKGKSDIAWDSIENIHRKTQEGMSRAQSVMYDDLKGFDTRWTKQLIDALLSAFRRSDFASTNLELRKAVEMQIVELAHRSTLQLSPTRYMDLRSVLWSGVWGTQLLGSVVHLAFYEMAEEEIGLAIVNRDVLSDDGKCETEHEIEELDKLMWGPFSDLLKSVGFILHPDKSFTADLDRTAVMGTKNGETVEYHDCGPFLQWFMGRDFIYGNFPRRIWSLYEKERDSSQEAMYDVVKKHAGALRDVRTGGQIPETYFDLFRCASVVSTMGPDTPVFDKVNKWFVNTWPSFERRFSKMFDTVDQGLWTADIPAAGGTLDSGLTVKSTIDDWTSLLDESYGPYWD